MCRYSHSAPGHQEHRSRNAHSCKWALSFEELVVLVSGLFPVQGRCALIRARTSTNRSIVRCEWEYTIDPRALVRLRELNGLAVRAWPYCRQKPHHALGAGQQRSGRDFAAKSTDAAKNGDQSALARGGDRTIDCALAAHFQYHVHTLAVRMTQDFLVPLRRRGVVDSHVRAKRTRSG